MARGDRNSYLPSNWLSAWVWRLARWMIHRQQIMINPAKFTYVAPEGLDDLRGVYHWRPTRWDHMGIHGCRGFHHQSKKEKNRRLHRHRAIRYQ